MTLVFYNACIIDFGESFESKNAPEELGIPTPIGRQSMLQTVLLNLAAIYGR